MHQIMLIICSRGSILRCCVYYSLLLPSWTQGTLCVVWWGEHFGGWGASPNEETVGSPWQNAYIIHIGLEDVGKRTQMASFYRHRLRFRYMEPSHNIHSKYLHGTWICSDRGKCTFCNRKFAHSPCDFPFCVYERQIEQKGPHCYGCYLRLLDRVGNSKNHDAPCG